MNNSDWILVPDKYIDKVDIPHLEPTSYQEPTPYQDSTPYKNTLSNKKKLPYLDEIKIAVEPELKESSSNKNISLCYPNIDKKINKKNYRYDKLLTIVSFTSFFLTIYLYKYYTNNIDC